MFITLDVKSTIKSKFEIVIKWKFRVENRKESDFTNPFIEPHLYFIIRLYKRTN